MTFMTLAFHAEKLHQPQVWRQTLDAARRLTRHGIRATFFVYPFPGFVYGEDITERVITLASLGHEIAQHTHFYAGRNIDKSNKVDDLSKENIAHCVRRDFEALSAMGHPPRGFTAGSWFVSNAVLDELVDLGFIYDCSAQMPKPGLSARDPRTQWLDSPQIYRSERGELLRLPTTGSLGEWFKRGRLLARRKHSQQIVYLHDFDLLALRGRLMLAGFLQIMRGEALQPSCNAAEK